MYSIKARCHEDRSDDKGEGRALAALILASSWPHLREEGLESTECHNLAALAQS